MTRLLGRVTICLYVAACSFAASMAFAASPLTNVAYGPDPADVLDIYPAAGPGPHRLVIFVHGGGWVVGNQAGGRRLAGPLNQAGYTLASINYRLVPQTNVAGSVADVAQAASFLLGHADRFGIDPSRFALVGHSSGGHVVALLGTDQRYLQQAGVDPHRLGAVVALDGVFDVAANLTHYPSSTRAVVFGSNPADWPTYSPISHIAGMQAHPTFCLLHEDTVARFIEQEALFKAALAQHGEKVLEAVAPGLRHGELMQLFDSGQPMAAFTVGCLAKSL